MTVPAFLKKHKKRRLLAIGFVTLVGLAAGGLIAIKIWFAVSPYPTAMLIRNSFVKGGNATNIIIEKYAPKYIATVTNIQYRANDPDAYLDVYYTPTNPLQAPTIM